LVLGPLQLMPQGEELHVNAQSQPSWQVQLLPQSCSQQSLGPQAAQLLPQPTKPVPPWPPVLGAPPAPPVMTMPPLPLLLVVFPPLPLLLVVFPPLPLLPPPLPLVVLLVLLLVPKRSPPTLEDAPSPGPK